MDTYKGWKNKQTWEVATVIANDESFYTLALTCKSYQDFLDGLWCAFIDHGKPGWEDSDAISFQDERIDREAIEGLFKQLKR